MFEKFTDEARRAMALANQEAQRMCHEYIGTEHLLLGLIKEGEGEAAEFLKEKGYSLSKVRREVEKLVRKGPVMVTMGKLPQTPRAKKIIEYSVESARKRGKREVDTIDLLYGAVQVKEGIAYQALKNLGFEDNCLEDYLKQGRIRTKQDFWHIPRNNLELDGFLDLCGYEMQTGKINHKKSSRVVGALGDSSPLALEVHYDPGNMEQMEEALRFRDVLDENGIKYKEVPPAREVSRKLKEPMGKAYSLIERLEKRVKE